jgi:hypothetical protein
VGRLSCHSANPNGNGGSSKASPINFFTFQSDESLTQKLHSSKIDRIYDEAGNVHASRNGERPNCGDTFFD